MRATSAHEAGLNRTRALALLGVCLSVILLMTSCASTPVAAPSRRAVTTHDVSFTDELGRTYPAEILVPSRPNGGAALLLGGGSATDMHWTVPASAELEGRVVQFTTTGQPIRDADAITASLLYHGFHVLRWSSIHRDDPHRAENPAMAEGLTYDKVRSLSRLALAQLRTHETTAGKPIVLIGHALGATRAVQIAADQPDIVALVLLSGAYLAPLADPSVNAGRALASRYRLELPASVAAVQANAELLSALSVTQAETLDVDHDNQIRDWELTAAQTFARLQQSGENGLLTDAMILNEPHPGRLLTRMASPVLLIYGSHDPLAVQGPIVARLAGLNSLCQITIRYEPGLGHSLGKDEPPPARDADILAGVLGPMNQRVIERFAAWASEQIRK